jgi:6-pyruvoyltetrahydropterin/6-carboxytetrahydropterin synthase
MLTITKEFIFHAAHRLFSPSRSAEENLQIYGNCAKLHGHTYRLQVTLAGKTNETGMILHFDELKQIVRRELLDRYDHANLNDLPEYRHAVPTAENMVEHMFGVLDHALRSERFQLEQIRLYETPTAWATRNRE